MANVSGLLGTAGGFKGTGVSGPDEDYRYLNTVTPEQVQAMNARAGGALDQQQAFLEAIQAQNGLQNQSNVYNQLSNIAAGTGPNPAMAQLQQTTGQNVANQAALMASQRGASQNAGLIARQASQQGANLQQQAVGQGAVLQAQQSMNALNSMGSLANTQAAQQAAATSGYNQMVQSEQAALGNQQATRAQAQAGVNQGRLGLIGGTAAQQAAIGGGGASGIGAAFAMADGGQIPQMQVTPIQTAPQGPQSFVGQQFASMQPASAGGDPYASAASQITSAYNQGQSSFKMPASKEKKEKPKDGGGGAQGLASKAMFLAASGGKVPVLLSPGERVVSPEDAKKAAGGEINPMKEGKKVPGKPKVGGAKNDYANDTFATELEPGSIVIPRSITQGKNPERNAIDFVRKHLAKSKKSK